MRWYQQDEHGLLTIKEGDWSVINGKAHRVDPYYGVDGYGLEPVGPVTLKGWPDSTAMEYEGGVILPVPHE